ncbi:MAG: metallophosphoesterase family protein, partial [Candidatus Omnitrophota bacterium]
SYAKEAILWTQKMLTADESQYLHSFVLRHQADDFVCVHGSLIEPEKFHYVWGVNDARAIFLKLDKHICFVGHSHKMEAYCYDGKKATYLCEYEFKLDPAKKYIINVGSVGQPRDRDPRACFCIYDTTEDAITFVRREYNVKRAAEKILDEKLPSILASRLYVGW